MAERKRGNAGEESLADGACAQRLPLQAGAGGYRIPARHYDARATSDADGEAATLRPLAVASQGGQGVSHAGARDGDGGSCRDDDDNGEDDDDDRPMTGYDSQFVGTPVPHDPFPVLPLQKSLPECLASGQGPCRSDRL